MVAQVSSPNSSKFPLQHDFEKMENLAVRILWIIGEDLFQYHIHDNSQLISGREYCRLSSVQISDNHSGNDSFFGFDVTAIRELINTSTNALKKTKPTHEELVVAKDLIQRMVNILEHQAYFEHTGKSWGSMPTLLAIENVREMSESMYCLEMTVKTYRIEQPKKNCSLVDKIKRLFS